MKSFFRAVSRLSASLLLLIFLSQCLFPHVDVLAATYRQKKLRLILSDITEKEQTNPKIKLMAQVLDFLPRAHYDSLLKIDYNPLYTKLPRGMAKDDHLIINSFQIDDDSEFASVFIHELGHVTDLGFLKDPLSRTKNSHFQYPNGKPVYQFDPSRRFYDISWKDSLTPNQINKNNFVSTYGMNNPFEDFAESYNFFVLHRSNFHSRSENNTQLDKKYSFLKNIVFQDQEFDFYSYENYPRIVSDTTLLPFDINKLLLYTEDRDNRRRISARNKLRRRPKYKPNYLSANPNI